MILEKKIFVIIFCAFFWTSKGQQSFKVPEAPKTFEYTKYDQIPVGEYTGIPNISIPLYTLAVDEVNMPLNLLYHAGGIRVSEEASYIGLGWNLNFGIITQTINGKDDLLYSDFRTKQKLIYQNSPLVSQWPITCGVISGPGVACVPDATVETYFSSIDGKPLAADFNSMFIATGPSLPRKGIGSSITNMPYGPIEFIQNFDYEPDIFRVSFFGHSLKFMQNFDSNYDEIIVLDNKGYKVTKIAFDSGKCDWNITTPDGTQYIFSNCKQESSGSAGSNLEPEGNYDNSGFGGSSYTNKWFLSKIITVKNKIITFNYTDYGISYAKSYDQKFRKIKQNSKYLAQSISGIYKGFGVYDTPANSEMTQTTFNTISESILYPSSIESDETKIYFNYSNRTDRENDKKLDKITVKNNINTIVKEYSFLYDYFISSNTGKIIRLSDNIFSPTSRLKLVAVQETGANPYEFIYDSVILPQKNSTAQDFWGFYNGKTANLSIAPNPAQLGLTGMGNNGNDNAANINFSKACSLKEIVYPTKGKITYEYELQEYIKDINDTALPNSDGSISSIIRGYGNRIKSITLSQDGIVSKKNNFSYTGGISIMPFKLYYSYNVNTGYLGGGTHTNPFSIQDVSITDFTGINYYRPALFCDINTVGYDSVTIEEIAVSTGNGKRVLEFHNNRAIPPSPLTQYQNYLILPARENINLVNNGHKISESIYDSNNFKVKEITNNYIINKSNIYYSTKIVGFRTLYSVLSFAGLSLLSAPQFLVGYYLIYDKHSLLSTEETTEYFVFGDAIQTNISYSYNNNNQISNIIKSNPVDGTFYEESISYAASPSSIITKNILNLPSSKRTYTNGKIKEQTNYTYEDASGIIVLKKMGIYPLGSPNPSKTKSVFYDSYDVSGNITEFHNDNGIHTCVIWGYNKTLPIAKIDNVTYSSIPAATISNLQNLSDADNDNCSSENCKEQLLRNQLNLLRTSFPNAMVTTYTHNPLIGVTSTTDPKGLTSYYEYDSSNRLILIKDHKFNILKTFCYNYKGQQTDCITNSSITTYKNSSKNGTYTKQGCTGAQTGSSHLYTVAAGTYSSTVSQVAADALAQADVTANGQNYANANGTCILPLPGIPIGLVFTSATNTTLTLHGMPLLELPVTKYIKMDQIQV